MDTQLRRLERAANYGDHEAQMRLVEHKFRLGLLPKICDQYQTQIIPPENRPWGLLDTPHAIGRELMEARFALTDEHNFVFHTLTSWHSDTYCTCLESGCEECDANATECCGVCFDQHCGECTESVGDYLICVPAYGETYCLFCAFHNLTWSEYANATYPPLTH